MKKPLSYFCAFVSGGCFVRLIEYTAAMDWPMACFYAVMTAVQLVCAWIDSR